MSWGRNQPSTIALLGAAGVLLTGTLRVSGASDAVRSLLTAGDPMEASSRARAGMARNAASVGFPIALANCAPMFSASGSVIMRAKKTAQDSAIAPLTSPLASGDAASALTAPHPADCPNMVTWFGSPPNWAMLFRTHWSAASWSSAP